MTVPPLMPDLTPEEWDAVAVAQGAYRLLPRPLRRKLKPFKKLLVGARAHLIAGLEPVLQISSAQVRDMVYFGRVQEAAFLSERSRRGSPSPTPHWAAWHTREGDTWPVQIGFDRGVQSFWFYNVANDYLHGFSSGYHATELPTLMWNGTITAVPWEALDLIDDSVVRRLAKCAHGLTELRAASLIAGSDFRLLDFIPYECAVEVDGTVRRFMIDPETEVWVGRGPESAS